MELDVEQFLDLVHYYWLTVIDPSEHEKLNSLLSGPRVTEDEKSQMLTEAARKIPVPSWWQGGTTVSDATQLVVRMRQKD